MLQNQWKLRLKYFLELFLNDHDRKNVDFIENLVCFFLFFENRFSSVEKSRLFILPLLQFSER